MSNKKNYIKLNKILLILSNENEKLASKILLWWDVGNQSTRYSNRNFIDFGYIKYEEIFLLISLL